MNGQTVAVQFNLNDDYTIKDVESYFSVFQSGYLRVSLFESFNGQPSNNLYSKNIYVENDGWQGLGDIGLDLAPSKYWVVFDYDPLDYQSRFRGGLNIFYEGDDVITKVKSDFPKYYQEGLQTSAGLIVSVNEISSVPLPSGLALFASGLSFLLIPLRKKFVK